MHLTEQSSPLFNRSHAAERHLRTADRRHGQSCQRLRAHAFLRADFQHHAVLVALREDGRHQPLTESVVQRVVYGHHAHAQATGRVPVYAHIGL